MQDYIDRHSSKTKIGLTLALGLMDEGGWFGNDSEGNRVYKGGSSASCVCAVVAIERAADILGLDRFALRSSFIEGAGIGPVPTDKAPYSGDGWGTIVNWNDVPNRHPVTVRRAFQRAIKKAA